jgi:hypothetical protein
MKYNINVIKAVWRRLRKPNGATLDAIRSQDAVYSQANLKTDAQPPSTPIPMTFGSREASEGFVFPQPAGGHGVPAGVNYHPEQKETEKTKTKMKIKTKLILLITLTLSFAIANTVSANFSQGFEANNNGWNLGGGQYDATICPSGTHGITSKTGGFHAEAPGPFQLDTGYPIPSGGSAYTNWGGYSISFPAAGYTTAIWIYLDATGAGTANDTRFDWIASAINQPDCEFRRDFVFNGGFYNDEGLGNRFVISAGNNSGRNSSYPKNPGHNPYTVTASGWYKFEAQFISDGGVLSVTMRLFNSGGGLLNTWTLSDPTDIIGTTVGGNRYGWFASQEFPFLAIDDSTLTGIQNYCEGGSGPAGSAGYWMNHAEAWCEQSITVAGESYSKTQAITLMRNATSRDMTYQMFAQLVAAKLNVDCLHSDQTCVIDAIEAADGWMADHHVGSIVRANSSAWKSITWAYNTLVNYNTGLLCAPPL